MKMSTYWLYVFCGIPLLIVVTAIGPHLVLSISEPKPGFIYVPTNQGWLSAFGFYIVGCVWLFYVTKKDREEQARLHQEMVEAEETRREKIAKADSTTMRQEFIHKTGMTASDVEKYLHMREVNSREIGKFVPTDDYLRDFLYGQGNSSQTYWTPEEYKTFTESWRRWEEKQAARWQAEKEHEESEKLRYATSVVYFIGNKHEGLVKIGYTTSLDKRLRTIQTSSPFPVSLFHAEPGTPDDERALHQKFAYLRKSGEWFWLKPPIEEYIQNRAQNRRQNTDLGPIFGY